MSEATLNQWVSLDVEKPIWSHFFTVAPLVVVGTKEGEHYNLAPKHMATPLGQDNFFGFVCTPKHATYHNIKREGAFTVSFIQPKQVVLSSVAAIPRNDRMNCENPVMKQLPVLWGKEVDAPLVKDAYLFLECELDRIVEDFGGYSLIAGKIVAAHIHRDALRISEADEAKLIQKMPMLAYLAYGRFAEISQTLAFPFPKHFGEDALIKPKQ